MSYRNPEQVVDRQSGQYVRQMQQSVASSFEKLANKISADNKERARKNEIMIREAEKRSEAAAQSIYQPMTLPDFSISRSKFCSIPRFFICAR